MQSLTRSDDLDGLRSERRLINELVQPLTQPHNVVWRGCKAGLIDEFVEPFTWPRDPAGRSRDCRLIDELSSTLAESSDLVRGIDDRRAANRGD